MRRSTRKPDAFANLSAQCRILSLPEPVPEFVFHETRKWRFDAAWPALKLAVEIEGIVYPKKGAGGFATGRHASVTGFKGDIEKYGEAFALGWTVLRVLPEDAGKNARAVSWLSRRLQGGR